ncbi:MAG TPA: hypothetical protein VGH74_17650, partial [Planctomycetaceae bacterium]
PSDTSVLPWATPAMVRCDDYSASGRDGTPCIARYRDRERSHRFTSTLAGLAAGSGLNDSMAAVCSVAAALNGP